MVRVERIIDDGFPGAVRLPFDDINAPRRWWFLISAFIIHDFPPYLYAYAIWFIQRRQEKSADGSDMKRSLTPIEIGMIMDYTWRVVLYNETGLSKQASFRYHYLLTVTQWE